MSDKVLKKVTDLLTKQFDGQVQVFRGETHITIHPDHIVEVARAIKDTLKFEMLASQTAVDYWPQTQPRYHIVCQFNSLSQKTRFEVRVPLDGNEPHCDSIAAVYPNANWFEREIFDMFGVHFNGHPDQRRILMPHDWEGHPLRKDYPLGYEEVEFSFNFEEIEQRKPRPKD
jgi:NADH-quinone oxidoreductase subunit C